MTTAYRTRMIMHEPSINSRRKNIVSWQLKAYWQKKVQEFYFVKRNRCEVERVENGRQFSRNRNVLIRRNNGGDVLGDENAATVEAAARTHPAATNKEEKDSHLKDKTQDWTLTFIANNFSSTKKET